MTIGCLKLACLLVMLAAAGPVGCARYEYDLGHPPELAQHIGSDKPVELAVEPLRYLLQTADGYLVMRVYNETDAPVKLLGDQGYVVDPRGQSRPLRSQTIAQGSYIKLIFPPLPPRVQPYGPVFGIGVGVGVTSGGYYRQRYVHGVPYGYDPVLDGPRYYVVYQPGDSTYYWDWPGEGEARVVLVYQRGEEKPFSHEFVFRRRKL